MPLLADGQVDVAAVMATFSVMRQGLRFSGGLLERDFAAQVDATEPTGPFTLSINAPDLSEHGVFLIAVLLVDITCLEAGRAPVPLNWQGTAQRVGQDWQVQGSCAGA